MEATATIPMKKDQVNWDNKFSVNWDHAMATHRVPFRWWSIKDFCRPLPEISDIEWEAQYDNDIEKGKQTCRELPPALESIFDRLQYGAFKFVHYFGGILHSDPTRHGAGLHRMNSGGWLQVHLDYNRHPKLPNFARRLNAILFLHHRWEPEWGGRLLLCNAQGEAIQKIDPLPGRLVIFETSDISFHGVEEISKDAEPRISLATYFLGEARPEETRLRAMFLPNRNTPYAPKEVRLP
jgi:Rps23 Pro-64 3,4-dihydroxylase Tpa1-like proline 4-hydroxylase